jgi:hypothetical protein
MLSQRHPGAGRDPDKHQHSGSFAWAPTFVGMTEFGVATQSYCADAAITI